MSIYLDKSLKIDDNKEFRLVQNSTMGEVESNQFSWLRNYLVNTAKKNGTE